MPASLLRAEFVNLKLLTLVIPRGRMQLRHVNNLPLSATSISYQRLLMVVCEVCDQRIFDPPPGHDRA